MAQWLRENSWRQGHFITADTARLLGLSHQQSPNETAIIVISHDFDLSQSIEVEPSCEIIVGRKIDHEDGNFANAKSIRRLHLKVLIASGENIIVELDVGGKTTIK